MPTKHDKLVAELRILASKWANEYDPHDIDSQFALLCCSRDLMSILTRHTTTRRKAKKKGRK